MQTPTPTPPDIQRIMMERFATGTPRSLAYKLGMRAVLEHRLYGQAFSDCPAKLGSAEADAYFAGCEEGKAIARKVLEKCEEVPA